MIRFLCGVLAIMLCACPSSQRAEPTIANTQPAPPASSAPTTDDRDVIVTTVLERFIAAPDSMPDHSLLPKTGPIYVLAEVGEPVIHTVQPGALPNNPRPFAIKPLAEIQAEADRTQATLAFIRFYGVEVHDNHARADVSIGVDLVLPGHSKAIKMCCCMASERWEKHDGRWIPDSAKVVSCS